MGVDPWTLGELNSMDTGLASVWGFQESVEDLKQKLLLTTLELDALRSNAKEEIKKSEENINQLLQLLKLVTYERNEARDQVQFLLNKIKQHNMLEIPAPLKQQHRGAECDNFSATQNHHQSYVSSPAESLFDNNNNNVNSPEFTSVNNIADNSYNFSIAQQQKHLNTTDNAKYQDKADAIIGCLAMRKPLPVKGKFVEAVVAAGPLLQTSLLAGPLPRWRNPPPLHPLQVPALSVKPPLQYQSANNLSTAVNVSPNHGKSANAVSQHCYSLPIRNFGATQRSMVPTFVANNAEITARRF